MELWALFNSHSCPRMNRVLRNQVTGHILNLVAYRLWKLQQATHAVHNRAAVCVASSSCIFENQL